MNTSTEAAPGKERSGMVQSVGRALELLEVIADSDTPLPLATIASETELAQPTAHRLLKTLISKGYVYQTDTRSYVLGTALIRLGLRATPELGIAARPVLTELEELSQETANLAVLDGDMIAYVAQAPSRHRMRMFTEVGRRVLPHAAGVGKAILASLPERRALEIVRRTGMPRFTDTTLTTEEALLADLRLARSRGYATDDGEQEVGVRCLAIWIPRSSPAAAVSISGPAARLTDDRIASLVEALSAAAEELSRS